MWLHEGHVATIKQFPQLLFTTDWVMFDFAVSNRNEGYTLCYDGENTIIDNTLRRLNDKGLVMRDHHTKKDTFYLYKAWWNPTPFVHICQKSYTKVVDRVIKCYSNDGSSFTLFVNNEEIETVTATNNIVLFTARTFTANDVVKVEGTTTSDTFTIAETVNNE
jgi:beta-galactosidase